MKRKTRLFGMILSMLLVVTMALPVLASDVKCGVDDGAVRRTIEEVQGKCGVDDGAVRRTIEEVQGKCGVDDGAVRRTKEEVQGKCGVDDGAVRRTKEEMALQNISMTDDQKLVAEVFGVMILLTVVLSIYICTGEPKWVKDAKKEAEEKRNK